MARQRFAGGARRSANFHVRSARLMVFSKLGILPVQNCSGPHSKRSAITREPNSAAKSNPGYDRNSASRRPGAQAKLHRSKSAVTGTCYPRHRVEAAISRHRMTGSAFPVHPRQHANVQVNDGPSYRRGVAVTGDTAPYDVFEYLAGSRILANLCTASAISGRIRPTPGGQRRASGLSGSSASSVRTDARRASHPQATSVDPEGRTIMTSEPSRSPQTAWSKASYCQGGECAELTRQGDEIVLRSTRSPEQVVRLTPAEWLALTNGIKADEFSHLA